MSRRLMRFDARVEQTRDFGAEEIDCGCEGEEQLPQEKKSSFLKAFVEFVETDFLTL
ncbi:MAG: hypothetical protein ABIH42_11435 [Planctomycetota bacterium]